MSDRLHGTTSAQAKPDGRDLISLHFHIIPAVETRLRLPCCTWSDVRVDNIPQHCLVCSIFGTCLFFIGQSTFHAFHASPNGETRDPPCQFVPMPQTHLYKTIHGIGVFYQCQKNIRKSSTNDTALYHHHNSTTIAIAKHQIHEFNMSPPLNPESYRTSCDRCRLQKLRCVSSFDSDWPSACQRCTRARVPCVYGRRARSGRRPKKPDNLNEEGEEEEEEEEEKEEEEEALTPSSSRLSSYPSIGHVDPIADPLGDLPLDGGPTANLQFCAANNGQDLTMHSPFPVLAPENWWPASSASSGAGPDLTESADQSLRMDHHHRAQEYYSENTPAISSRDNYAQQRHSHSHSHHAPTNTPPPPPLSSTTQTNTLTALLAATTTYASHLHHYRQQNSTNLLLIQDYPISEAAHLAQWLWKTLLFRHRAERQSKRSRHDDPPPTDTPSLLMALSCYISLVSIYDTLRSDLQPVLAALPLVIPSPAELQRGLNVGELPLTGEGTVRILNAVRTLLDALDAVEDGLCVVRDVCGL